MIFRKEEYMKRVIVVTHSTVGLPTDLALAARQMILGVLGPGCRQGRA
jgi:hypothetical protein